MGKCKPYIHEDDAYAIYTLIEQRKWVHLGSSAKPDLQMSRRIRKGGYELRLRKGKVWWFADRKLAKRVHKEVQDFLAAAGKKKAGDNRCPKYVVAHDLLEATIIHCANEANIEIIRDRSIFRARGFRDARIMRRIGR